MTELCITGRCYCGKSTINAHAPPQVVTYCHCADCRRASGAPVAAFAGFSTGDVNFAPALRASATAAPDAERWFCPDCGSPLASTYAYLPGQVYVPLGLLDQADTLEPQGHAHTDAALPWLHIQDNLPKTAQSARESLKR